MKKWKKKRERKRERNDRGWETTFAHRSRENEIENNKRAQEDGGPGRPLFLKDFRPRSGLLRALREGTSAASKLVETNVAECRPICILIVPVSASP